MDCSLCSFSRQHDQMLYCERYPPTLFMRMAPGLNPKEPQMIPSSAFPPVMPTWRCGEFQLRSAVANDPARLATLSPKPS